MGGSRKKLNKGEREMKNHDLVEYTDKHGQTIYGYVESFLPENQVIVCTILGHHVAGNLEEFTILHSHKNPGTSSNDVHSDPA